MNAIPLPSLPARLRRGLLAAAALAIVIGCEKEDAHVNGQVRVTNETTTRIVVTSFGQDPVTRETVPQRLELDPGATSNINVRCGLEDVVLYVTVTRDLVSRQFTVQRIAPFLTVRDEDFL